MRQLHNTFSIGLGLLACFAAAQNGHRVVIEVNVTGKTPFGTILNNATNLRKAFAPEPIQIEVVCHGPGLDLLLRKSPMAKRVSELAKSGVVFAACANTIRGRHLSKSSLLPFTRIVPSGVAEVVRKQEAGWSYLKGAF